MLNKELIVSSIEQYIECWEGSRTDSNKDFVDGIIYGLRIALARTERGCEEIESSI